MSVSLRRLVPLNPEEILNGPYGDWLLLMLLCGLFIALSGAVLPRHLTEKRYGKAVVVFAGLVLGLGLFKAKEIYKFNLESFGFMAVWLIVLIMGFVIYGLTKMGMAKTTAISVTYCIIFLSFFLLSPSLFDAIAESFPIVNLIFVVLFFYMLGKPLFTMFGRKNLLKAARKIQHTNFSNNQDVEIEREIEADKKETKDLKKRTIPATKKELRSIFDIEKLLENIIKTINENEGQLSGENKEKVSANLKKIYQNETILDHAMRFIRFHIESYNRHHKRDVNEIQQRINQTKLAKQKKTLQDELHYQRRMLEVISFMNKLESKEPDFVKSFNSLVFHAVNRLANNNVNEALAYLGTAKSNLEKMVLIYKKQKELEKYLVKTDRALIKNLNQEEKNVHEG